MVARILRLESKTVVLMDAVDYLESDHAGAVVVTGSHGGLLSARTAIQHPPALVVFHDAGIGKDAAGTAGLDLLAQFGIPAVTVSSESARIGDAEDTFEHGRISFVNPPAEALGCEPGRLAKETIAALPAKPSS